MKRNKKIGMIIGISIGGLITIIAPAVFVSMHVYQSINSNPYGPYVKPAVIDYNNDVISFGGKKLVLNKKDNKVWEIKDNSIVKNEELKNYNVWSIQVDNCKLYCTYYQYINIFDEDFNLINQIDNIPKTIYPILPLNSFIYYVDYTDQQHSNSYTLFQLNIETKQKTIYSKYVTLNSKIYIEGNLYYLDNSRNFYPFNEWEKEVQEILRSETYITFNTLIKPYTIDIDNGEVSFGNPTIDEENLYFSTFRFDEKEDYIIDRQAYLNRNFLSVSNIGKTYLYTFNRESETITSKVEFKENAFVIFRNKETIVYYLNGTIYKNNDIYKTISTIKDGEKQYSRHSYMEMEFADSYNLFSFYSGEVFYGYENK